MAKVVAITFQNENDADAFVFAAQNLTEFSFYEGAEVVGVYKLPTMFCPGSGGGGCDQGKRYRSWTKGQKWGWWVCAVCKKPAKPRTMDNLVRHIISQARNLLLDPLEDTPSTVHDEGWGAFRNGVNRV